MLPNEKQLKSLIKKIKKNTEKKYEVKQQLSTKVDEALDNREATSIFQEMKKLPFAD